MRLLGLVLSLYSFMAFADIEKAPQNFTQEGKASIWVDFIKADYKVVYNKESQSASTYSIIHFEQRKEGYPLFDLVSEPSKVLLNGESVKAKLIKTPGEISQVRRLSRKLIPGVYTLEIYSDLEHGIEFDKNCVRSNFWVKDMLDRNMLERYLPTSLEYDQYKMNLEVLLNGFKKEHKIYTNGKIENLSHNHFKINFPSFYNASSIYYHLVPKGDFREITVDYKSVNGKVFPVTVYSGNLLLTLNTRTRTLNILDELEGDYGPWPHDALVVYADGNFKGGMEYPGATKTGWFALGHELQHNYFARAVMPANGNAGWIDEAVASWRDYFHYGVTEPDFNQLNLGNHSQYMRKTDKRSYAKGRNFLAYISKKYKAPNKRLKDFFKFYFEKRKYTTVTNQDFLDDLIEYYDSSIEEDFNRYIMGETID